MHDLKTLVAFVSYAPSNHRIILFYFLELFVHGQRQSNNNNSIFRVQCFLLDGPYLWKIMQSRPLELPFLAKITVPIVGLSAYPWPTMTLGAFMNGQNDRFNVFSGL